MPRIPATYEEVTRRIKALGGTSFGQSVEGQPLWQIHLGRSPDRPVLVLAGLHALEHAGVLAALELAERAVGAPAWRARRLVVVPLANPDGFRAVEAEDGRRFRRGNARGVDLNRNFAEGWQADHWLARLFSGLFASGAAPLSEPETAALDRLAAETRPSVVASLHAFGRWLYLPYASRRERAEDFDVLAGEARRVVAAMPRPYRIVQLARRSRFFTAPGAELDHFLVRHDAWTFLFEIGGFTFSPAPLRWYTGAPERLRRDLDDLAPALDVLASVRAGLPSR